MSADLEVDEGYFLQRQARNCGVEGAKRMRGKRGHETGKKMPIFSFRALATVNKRLIKAKLHEFIRSSIALPKSSCLL